MAAYMTSWSDLRRLVACSPSGDAAEDRLSFRRNPHTSFADQWRCPQTMKRGASILLSFAHSSRVVVSAHGWRFMRPHNTCITAKTYAVLTPNSSIPLTASRAPIIRQGR
jgi:hypothetical protein